MLFVGNGVLDQRARGLMWLELAKDGAPNKGNGFATSISTISEMRATLNGWRLRACGMRAPKEHRRLSPQGAASPHSCNRLALSRPIDDTESLDHGEQYDELPCSLVYFLHGPDTKGHAG